MKYKAVSFNGVYYCIEQCDDNYSPAENELILNRQEEAETFPIPCRWDEKTQSWESAPIPDEVKPKPDPDALPKAKKARVVQSKSDLESYLASHPITWTDGNPYSITREKQQQLTSKILSAVLAAQTSTPYDLTWNATGEECTSWTLEEISALAFAIDARVTALVSYQQKKEVEILAAQTLEELERIEVDYDTVE